MKTPILFALLAAALLLSACGFSDAEVQSTVAAAETAAVSSAYAQLTQIALLTPSPTNTPTSTNTPMATATLFATATTSALTGGSGCDAGVWVADVTVPDGEEIAAGTTFTKTWSVQNTGTCDWTTSYQLIFSSGDQMGGPSSQSLTATIAAGATGEISVALVAPSQSGTYTGYWGVANASGQAFAYFSVVIEVP